MNSFWNGFWKGATKGALVGFLCLVLPLCALRLAVAQEFSWAIHVYQALDAETKHLTRVISPANFYSRTAVLGVTEVDMRNGGGSAYGVYGAASSKNAGTTGQREIVGVYGRVDKQEQVVAIGVHSECWETTYAWVGGQCILFNGEMQATSPGGEYIGMNLQAKPDTRNITGIQLQGSPDNFKYSLSAPNLPIHLGQVDDVPFCLKFVPSTQRLEFWRGCDRPGATRHGWVNMNWGTPDRQLN